jgi:hypothetical protein
MDLVLEPEPVVDPKKFFAVPESEKHRTTPQDGASPVVQETIVN